MHTHASSNERPSPSQGIRQSYYSAVEARFIICGREKMVTLRFRRKSARIGRDTHVTTEPRNRGTTYIYMCPLVWVLTKLRQGVREKMSTLEAGPYLRTMGRIPRGLAHSRGQLNLHTSGDT